MRIVVDTNVFVSAAFKTSSRPASVIRWIDRHDGLLKSTATEAQLIEVLRRPYIARKLPPDYQQWVNRLLSTAELVMITERIVQCRDPTDDKFLELAVNGRADMVVTGDLDLLILNPFRNIPIIGPADFVQGVVDDRHQ